MSNTFFFFPLFLHRASQFDHICDICSQTWTFAEMHVMLDDYRVFTYDSTSDVFSHPFGQLESLSTVWRDLRDCTNFKTGYFNLVSRNANLTMGLKGIGFDILFWFYDLTRTIKQNMKSYYTK